VLWCAGCVVRRNCRIGRGGRRLIDRRDLRLGGKVSWGSGTFLWKDLWDEIVTDDGDAASIGYSEEEVYSNYDNDKDKECY
jgi:hypothetical protein